MGQLYYRAMNLLTTERSRIFERENQDWNKRRKNYEQAIPGGPRREFVAFLQLDMDERI
jgi:hypothetical protein